MKKHLNQDGYCFLVTQTRNETVSNLLSEVDEAHQDLEPASSFNYYYNQTLKMKMGFEWAETYCNFLFLLKLDDDVFVHIARLLSFLIATATTKTLTF